MHTLWSIDSQKMSKIGATRCQILRLKCTKLDFRWGSAQDPDGGAYSAPPDSLAVLNGPTSKGREGEKGRGREGERKGKGRAGEGREGKGGNGKGKERKGGKRGEWAHAPIGIFESRRLCSTVFESNSRCHLSIASEIVRKRHFQLFSVPKF